MAAALHRGLGGAARFIPVRREIVADLSEAKSARWRSIALPLLGSDGIRAVRRPNDPVVDALVGGLVGCRRRGSDLPVRIVLVAGSPGLVAPLGRGLDAAVRRVWALRS